MRRADNAPQTSAPTDLSSTSSVDDRPLANSSNENMEGESLTEFMQEKNSESNIRSTEKEEEREREEREREEREKEENGLEPVISVPPSVNNTSSIPNGGLKAWLQVLGSFFLFFNSWGVVNTFGSYQTYYETVLLTSSSPSSISWIGSIQAFLLMMVGAITGPIYDAGYFRELLIGGSFMLVLGQMMLSLCKEYWQVLLAQALCTGIGCGALFVPSVAILSTYFTTKLATAMGLAAAGSSIGGVLYPIIFHKLLPRIGFAWTTRVIGFIILATMIIPNAVMQVRVLPATKRALLDLSAFRQPSYVFNVVGFFVGFVGLYMPFFYSQVYAIEKHFTSTDFGFYLLSIMNSTSTFGRIFPNWLADKIGPFNVGIPCTLASALLCFGFIGANGTASIVALVALYGFFSGTFVSLPPTILVHLSANHRSKIGARMGQGFAITAMGMLIGTPIGGAIRDASGGFTAVWAYAGSMLVVACVILVAARGCHRGWQVCVKA
ncbi:MFS general substrate transporter [Delitschia confertaspora ATCC 74209]|uniref:MFS general substrate transporter n=1 Tax=Delitschia confertaspora ATCC 74209 TaxID=1513339 RepID=A0A9P4JQ86_9PLEO|nr:MFS general substrate transporter [Delitschia confertaspora ATCC 74209]